MSGKKKKLTDQSEEAIADAVCTLRVAIFRALRDSRFAKPDQVKIVHDLREDLRQLVEEFANDGR